MKVGGRRDNGACEGRAQRSWKKSADYLPEPVLLGGDSGGKALQRDLQRCRRSAQEPVHGPARQSTYPARAAGAKLGSDGEEAGHEQNTRVNRSAMAAKFGPSPQMRQEHRL